MKKKTYPGYQVSGDYNEVEQDRSMQCCENCMWCGTTYGDSFSCTNDAVIEDMKRRTNRLVKKLYGADKINQDPYYNMAMDKVKGYHWCKRWIHEERADEIGMEEFYHEFEPRILYDKYNPGELMDPQEALDAIDPSEFWI